MNKVQQAAFELIQEDARFIYALVHIMSHAKNIKSNYISMSLPYIGLFADGSEQWCRKAGLSAPRFNDEEKEYYTKLRQGHKLFEKSYDEYSTVLYNCLYDRRFRNCLAHYGLGQYITEREIDDSDILKGLTMKAFGKDYMTVKSELYAMLKGLANQIKEEVLI